MAKKKVEAQSFLELLRQDYGKAIVDIYNEDAIVIDTIPTGSLALDASIGIGGVPQGRFTVIWGSEGSGKSTLVCNIAKEAILQDKKVLYIDVENMLDIEYTERIVGTIDTNKLVIVQPNTAEDSLNIALKAFESGEFKLVIIDSIGALSPQKEQEDELVDVGVAAISRLLARFLRKARLSVRENNVAVVFINQVRDNIGAYMGGYSMPGGHALKHFASLIIFLSKIQDIKKADEVIGITVKFVIKKNKLAPPFKSSTFPMKFGMGVDKFEDMLDFAVFLGVITRAGPYYKFNDIQLGKGVLESTDFISKNPELQQKIRERVLSLVQVNKNESLDDEDEVEEYESEGTDD